MIKNNIININSKHVCSYYDVLDIVLSDFCNI